MDISAQVLREARLLKKISGFCTVEKYPSREVVPEITYSLVAQADIVDSLEFSQPYD